MSRGQPTYPLTVVAQLVGLSPRTIRGYEEALLIEPTRIGGNRQRMYSEQDLQWLRCIRDMIHDEGLTVTAIRRLLDLIPCWQIRHCADSIALRCAPHQNVPGMAQQAPAPREPMESAQTEQTCCGKPDETALEIKLIYGVEELGAVMHCSRCISAERMARRVALRFPGKVTVGKYSIRSDEAQALGVVQSPTVIVDDDIVSSGKGMNEEGLATLIAQRLGTDPNPPA